MNFLRKLFRLPPKEPPKPTRIVKCYYCQEDVKTEIMEGDVAHMLCILAQDTIDKVKREKEEADRHQIELYKIALKEYEQEKVIKSEKLT